MNKNLRALLVIVIAVVVGLGIAALAAWDGGRSRATAFGWPLLLVCAGLAFAVQWAAFIPAYLLKTEKFYDLSGSATYLLLLACVAKFGPPRSLADLLVLVLCGLWAVRLGTFLFLRVHKDGSDKRFAQIKTSFFRFAVSWTLQGLWVFLTLLPVLIVVASPQWHSTTAWTMAGAAIWAIGFATEVIADWQKRQFRADPSNAAKFIQTGLWAWSRHPNYAGEIVLWVGIFVMCVPMLSGWHWVAVASPLFVALLLTKVSGVPLLEASADKRWGEDAGYLAYKQSTPVLWPRSTPSP
jgi:steroid 5-alpha reductase family enzyme